MSDDESGAFILDQNKVLRDEIFTCHKINDELLGIGFLLPKRVPIYKGKEDKKKIVGYEQIYSPAIITSNHEFHEPSTSFENKYKLKYSTIPGVLPLRISLNTIKSYLDKKTKVPNKLELFNRIKERCYKDLIYFGNPDWYDIHTLWDMGTYYSQLFNSYPIFDLNGLSGTAKSKVMKTSRLISFNPTEIMVNPSEASLFRITHETRPTKYIDEAEKLYTYIGGQYQASPLIELINGSYTRGSTVPRVEKAGNKFIVQYFGCYSPTMIGSIAGLRDATATRAITHIMTKSPDNDKRGQIEVESVQDLPGYQKIRDDLYLLVFESWQEVLYIYEKLSCEKLKKRDWELWKPILTMAKFIDEQLYQNTLVFAEKVSLQKRNDYLSENSLDFKILKVVQKMLNVTNVTNIRLKELCVIMNQGQIEQTAEKTISAHMDKLGFKDRRGKDREGSFFDIDKGYFDSIVATIAPSLVDYSSHSSHSSHSNINGINKCDESVTNVTNTKIENSQNVTNVTNTKIENSQNVTNNLEQKGLIFPCKKLTYDDGSIGYTPLCLKCKKEVVSFDDRTCLKCKQEWRELGKQSFQSSQIKEVDGP